MGSILVSVLQCKATTTICVHLMKPEECDVKINLIRQFSFFFVLANKMTVTSRISQHHFTSLVKTVSLKRILCTYRERNFTVCRRYKDTVKISTERTNCKRLTVLLCIAYCGRNIWTLQHAKVVEECFIRVVPHVSCGFLIATDTSIRIHHNGVSCKTLGRYESYENAIARILGHELTRKRINKSRHLKSYKQFQNVVTNNSDTASKHILMN